MFWYQFTIRSFYFFDFLANSLLFHHAGMSRRISDLSNYKFKTPGYFFLKGEYCIYQTNCIDITKIVYVRANLAIAESEALTVGKSKAVRNVTLKVLQGSDFKIDIYVMQNREQVAKHHIAGSKCAQREIMLCIFPGIYYVLSSLDEKMKFSF